MNTFKQKITTTAIIISINYVSSSPFQTKTTDEYIVIPPSNNLKSSSKANNAIRNTKLLANLYIKQNIG